MPAVDRRVLPTRRGHEALEFVHAGLHYTAGIGRFPDGAPAELFLNAAKSGTDADVNVRDGSIICSIAFQYGVPIDTIRHSLTRNSDGTASGPLGRLLDLLNEPEAQVELLEAAE
jgi:hypothetical protein